MSVSALPLTSPPQLLLPSFESELQLSSALHVSDLSLASCEAEYRLPKLNQAPDLLSTAFTPNIPPSSIGQNKDQLKQFAACLATPTESAEPEERETEQLRQLNRNIRSQSSLMSTGFQVMEDPISAYHKSSARWEEWLRRMRRKKRDDLFKSLFSKLGSTKPFSWESPGSI